MSLSSYELYFFLCNVHAPCLGGSNLKYSFVVHASCLGGSNLKYSFVVHGSCLGSDNLTLLMCMDLASVAKSLLSSTLVAQCTCVSPRLQRPYSFVAHAFCLGSDNLMYSFLVHVSYRGCEDLILFLHMPIASVVTTLLY